MNTTGRDPTIYQWDDTQWEYKIVRARNREFGQREHVEALLSQESLAGWVMVDKYNNSQIRFKRHRTAQRQDRYLPHGLDPYRTIYVAEGNTATQKLHLMLMALVLGVALAALVVIGVLASLPA